MLRSHDRIIEYMKIPMNEPNDLLWKNFENITGRFCAKEPLSSSRYHKRILLTSSLFSCYITSLTVNKPDEQVQKNDIPQLYEGQIIFFKKMKSLFGTTTSDENIMLSISQILIKLTKILSIEYLNDKYKEFFKQPPRKFLSLIIFLTECCLKKNPLELDLIDGLKIQNIISEYMTLMNNKSNLDGLFLTS